MKKALFPSVKKRRNIATAADKVQQQRPSDYLDSLNEHEEILSVDNPCFIGTEIEFTRSRSVENGDNSGDNIDVLNISSPELHQLFASQLRSKQLVSKANSVATTRSRNQSQYSWKGDVYNRGGGGGGVDYKNKNLSSHSFGGSAPQDYLETPMVDQDDIIALTHHVRSFSVALNSLRDTFPECEADNSSADETRAQAHDRLGDVLSILKGVLRKYPPLNSSDILTAAGTVISRVKLHNYVDSREPPDFNEATDQLALAFSRSVSDFLMGDQDNSMFNQSPSGEYALPHAQSFDQLPGYGNDLDEYGGKFFVGADDEDEDDYQSEHLGSEDSIDKSNKNHIGSNDRLSIATDATQNDLERSTQVDLSLQRTDELDRSLIDIEGSVDIALQRTKIWSKYAKDLMTYMERRSHLEVEFAKNLSKLAQSTRSSITEDSYLPFQSVFVTALDSDLEFASNCQSVYANQLQSKIIEPLGSRRTDHDRKRSKLKDMWTKECKRLQESRINLKKAKALYLQKQQELEKFSRQVDGKDGGESGSTPFSLGKKKTEEAAARKAEDSEESYRTIVDETNRRQKEVEKVKKGLLLELRQLVYQCDMTMKAVTCAYFQMIYSLNAPLPIQYQTLAESSKQYEVGMQFSEYVRLQQSTSLPANVPVYSFESFHHHGRRVQRSASSEDFLITKRRSSVTSNGSDTSNHRPSSPVNITRKPRSAWGQSSRGSASDDTGSVSSRSLPGSPNASPMVNRKEHQQHEHPRGSGYLSDDDKEYPKGSPGPFRNCNLSAPAKSHQFKKLRSPSRCKECDSYVYFNGAECEQCGLACHKKCLQNLAIRCGYKRLQRRMTTFGVDFQRHLAATRRYDIPYIIEHCISEIESRGLDVKGIYRVSGVKSKVEKLCQQFEMGVELVDLSATPPHLIASVLKLYIRQLPEPLMTFKLYNEFIDIGKESMTCKLNVSTGGLLDEATEDEATRCEDVIRRLHQAIQKLPHANFCTIERLLRHLRLVANRADSNHMTVQNLAIVFGPTLLKPSGSPSSMTALMDMPHQTRVVEVLVANYQIINRESDDEISTTKDDEDEDTPVEEVVFGHQELDRSCSIQVERSTDNTNHAESNTVDSSAGSVDRISVGEEFSQEFFDIMAQSTIRMDEEKEKNTGLSEQLPGLTNDDETDALNNKKDSNQIKSGTMVTNLDRKEGDSPDRAYSTDEGVLSFDSTSQSQDPSDLSAFDECNDTDQDHSISDPIAVSSREASRSEADDIPVTILDPIDASEMTSVFTDDGSSDRPIDSGLEFTDDNARTSASSTPDQLAVLDWSVPCDDDDDDQFSRPTTPLSPKSPTPIVAPKPKRTPTPPSPNSPLVTKEPPEPGNTAKLIGKFLKMKGDETEEELMRLLETEQSLSPTLAADDRISVRDRLKHFQSNEPFDDTNILIRKSSSSPNRTSTSNSSSPEPLPDARSSSREPKFV